ncbi:MAG: aminotransferase class V-fold PLP-dependent enzyme [Pyrinomonadaceae bacterium MAG19_C2-C3]|nr:aminotransferase class V-fold PLP-dependent enzyme [Pyrinomonadaceae bacterium MAG19_C2-C3]
MTDELLKWRDEFPILGDTTYLISHSLGAMPRRVYERMNEYAETWATRGIRAWAEGWWEMPLSVGDVLAPIIGAPPRTVAMHQNVSVCQSLILSCFPPRGRRNKIVYSSLEFPSVTYVYEAHARDGSYRIVTVPSDDGIRVSNERLLEAIDEETLLVPISHVLFKSAFLQDARAITERAHEVGAIVVLDTYQSAGTVPFSVTDLDVDFATGGSVKWLCGGAGAGYLYVHPRWHDVLEPKVTGWMAHEQPFAFEAGAIKYASGIARFLHGSPAIPTLYSARSGYEIINEIGIENIRAKNQRQTTKLIELAEAAGFDVTSPRDAKQRGGTITVNAPHAANVVKSLAEENILVDFRPGAGVRISPHFYTSDEELTRIIESMKRIVDTKAFAGHEAAAAY